MRQGGNKHGWNKTVVAGHICIDITPVFPDRPQPDVGSILTPGKLIHMQGVNVHTGGAVANTGLAMKKLGCDVSLMGKVGRDDFGALVLQALAQYGADQDMIVDARASTSYSVVLAIPGIDRIFLHDSGANDHFTCTDLDMEKVRRADLFHFGYPPLMKQFYQDDGRELETLLRTVKEAGVAVSLDLASVDATSEAGQANWQRILERALPWVDFFVPSAEELCFMLDPLRYEDWVRRAAGRDVAEILTPEEVAPLGERCLQLGAKVVLIKCGSRGMYYRTAAASDITPLCEKLSLAPSDWAGICGFEKSFKPDAVRSGTGAGDTSIAAFLTAVLNGESLHSAVALAAAAGACCVSAYDALSGLEQLDALKARIAQGWEKNP
ncbi:MAG: carbohydrate kinase family protein [Clostridiales bacterium]|nr:carbohydrate kinase family protein [Clostridiales bacterium]